jgi:hypothetical protein
MNESLRLQPITFRRLLTDGSAEAITDHGVVLLVPPAAMAAFRRLRVGQRLLASLDDDGFVTEVRLPT